MISSSVFLGPLHSTPEEFENASFTGHFGFVFEKKKPGINDEFLRVL